MGSAAGGVKARNSLDLCDLGVSAVERLEFPHRGYGQTAEVALVQTAHHQKETLTFLAPRALLLVS